MSVAIDMFAERGGVGVRIVTLIMCAVVFCGFGNVRVCAQQPASAAAKILRGVVHDPLGVVVSGASVDLIVEGSADTHTVTDGDGKFQFEVAADGRYSVRVSAASFEPVTVAAIAVRGAATADLAVTLATPTLTQEITVSATGTPIPEAQTGASVTVLQAKDLRYPLEVQDPLRLAPGVQVTQIGQMGGSAGLSIRGGDTDATKVLIDGIPANQIGGVVEFANIATVGVQSVEILNEPDSVLYGSDAMAGVVNLTSVRAASTPLPLFTYSGDAGNFRTYRNEVSANTVYRQFDLYSAYARVQTSNDIANSAFHNGTYAGNFGWTPNGTNDLRLTVRHIDVSGGQPNAIALYGIADDGQQKEQDLYLAGAWHEQTTARWHNLVRYGYVRLNGTFNDFAATGILDANTGFYDGAAVTITGANGYSVSGQALFQFSNGAPSYLEHNRDSSIYAQTDYRFSSHVVALGAFKYESESGSAAYAGSTVTPISRGNYDYSAEFSGDVRNRLFYTAGTGLEDNGLFGFAATPRASLAYYLIRPTGNGLFTGTKLHGTFGKGIKEPSVFQQQNSLYGLVNGGALANSLHVGPLGPESSRTFDGGVDQQLLDGRAMAGVTYFHDEFTNRVEYVPQSELILLGLPGASQNPVAENGGAYLNSSAFRSQGIEFRSEVRLSRRLFARAGYTYTDAVVQRSFSSDNTGPSFNTSSSFANVPIGAFSPLVGARPFRVAPHTGYFAVEYNRSKLNATVTGTMVSRRDDSDFLTDSNFGTSLLLPNRNLDGAYQRLELSGGYQLAPRVNVYANIQNLLSEHYFEAFGFPSLPLTFRMGVKLNFGGESWKLK
jgi:vitamin B12 transporter